MRTLLAFVALLAAVYVGMCGFLYARQGSMIYYPQPRNLPTGQSSMPLVVDDTALVVTVRPSEGTQALIYFGGNGEDVSRSLEEFAAHFPEHALYLMHYRGYGGSAGEPSELALKADALALFDQVLATHSRIAVVGRSLGSGIALHVASQRPVERLVLVTPYDSIAEIAAEQFPVFPVRWLLIDKYESWRLAPTIKVPTTVLVAESDQIIPRSSSDRLMAAFAPGIATLHIIDGTGHNSISGSSMYWSLLRQGAGNQRTASSQLEASFPNSRDFSRDSGWKPLG